MPKVLRAVRSVIFGVILAWFVFMFAFFAYSLTIRVLDNHIEYLQIRDEQQQIRADLKAHSEGRCVYDGSGRCIYNNSEAR